MKEFEPWLDSRWFYRCHKSHIVNLMKARKCVNHDGLFAMMTDGSMPRDIEKRQGRLFEPTQKHYRIRNSRIIKKGISWGRVYCLKIAE